MKSSDSSAKSASPTLPLLFRLIEAKDWEKLTNMFFSDTNGKQTFQYLSSLVSKSTSFNGMTILHAVARFNPPAVLVAQILRLCPYVASSQDCMNRTPLHVAAGCKASTGVIKVLAHFYPETCMMKDNDGKTPLHMACDSSCELFEDDRGEREQFPPSYQTIVVLLSTELDSAILEDNDGGSAIEYALCSNADLRTVRLLQKAAQRVNKKNEAKNKTQVASIGKISQRGLSQMASLLKVSQSGPSPPAKGFAPRGLLGAPLA